MKAVLVTYCDEIAIGLRSLKRVAELEGAVCHLVMVRPFRAVTVKAKSGGAGYELAADGRVNRLDAATDPREMAVAAGFLNRGGYDLVGIGVRSFGMDWARDLAGRLHARPIVAGGWGPIAI